MKRCILRNENVERLATPFERGIDCRKRVRRGSRGTHIADLRFEGNTTGVCFTRELKSNQATGASRLNYNRKSDVYTSRT